MRTQKRLLSEWPCRPPCTLLLTHGIGSCGEKRRDPRRRQPLGREIVHECSLRCTGVLQKQRHDSDKLVDGARCGSLCLARQRPLPFARWIALTTAAKLLPVRRDISWGVSPA